MADEDTVTRLDGTTITRTDIVESNKNYYQDAYEKKLTDICDFSDGSEVRTLHESLAVDVINLYRFLNSIQRSVFIDTAKGCYLDYIGCEFHLSRHKAEVATGQVTFSIPELLSSDLTISQGTIILQKETGYEYVLDSNVTISQGSLTATGNVHSRNAGARYNANKDTLTAFLEISRVRNIVKVTNPEAITGGVDGESDQHFRERIKNVKRERAYGTVPSYTNLIKEGSANVHDVQFVNPLLLTKSGYPSHLDSNGEVCTSCKRVLFVNANSKPCPNSTLREVEYVMSQQNNLVIGHDFHVQGAEPKYLYLGVHVYCDSIVDEAVIVDHIETFLDGGEVDEATSKKSGVVYTGLNIRDTLYKNQLIDVIENVLGVHHVESIHRLYYNKDITSNGYDGCNWVLNGSDNNESGFTLIDDNGYVYSMSSVKDGKVVNRWGEQNFEKIELRSGYVFALGSMKSVDSSCDNVILLNQEKV
ncbi:MAG: hypothetical protein BZ136_07550 [Methanosphaera sp. rholeuAM74]|nr:MAG: hypothetical protein BZ136_07550 [Methanosphaera sp. rholeuAM74]